MKYVFLLSSKAGAGSFSELEHSIVKCYESNNLKYKIIKTEYKNHASEIVRKYRDCSDVLLYVCSGDGTLNEVVNAMKQTAAKFSVGLIPSGTANDFSKNFDYSSFKIENTIKPVIDDIDLIKVNGRYCVNVLSFGFDTVILNSAYNLLKKNPKLRANAYPLAVFQNIFKIPKYKLESSTSNGENGDVNLKGYYLLVAICNGGFYGGGFNPSPYANLTDGVLEMCLAEAMPLYKIIPLIFKYKKGAHLSHPLIHFQKLTKGSIKFEKELMVNVDGEIFTTDFLDFEVVPKALRFARVCDYRKI